MDSTSIVVYLVFIVVTFVIFAVMHFILGYGFGWSLSTGVAGSIAFVVLIGFLLRAFADRS